MWLGWLMAAVGVALAAMPAHAEQPMTIDLTYESVMDMVRPDSIPDLRVHHRLHVDIDRGGNVSEGRNRNAGIYADRNATAQSLDRGGEDEAGVSWSRPTPDRLVRDQEFPQSTRRMVVDLSPDGTCRLSVTDTLKPGYREYEFLRLKARTMAFFSRYEVTATSCHVR